MRRWLIPLLMVLVLIVPSGEAGSPTLLIRAERRTPTDRAALRLAGFPVVHETTSGLFFEGNDAHVAGLRERGFEVTVLDGTGQVSDYWQVALRPDSDLTTLEAVGAVVHAEANLRFYRVPRDTPLDAVFPARVLVSRLPHRPVDAPVSAPLRSDEAGATAPDPLIQQMVDGIRIADIDAYWSALVTNPPTGTRFSTSQGCRDATTYCHEQLEAAKVPAEYQTYSGSHAPNVVGTLTGGVTPERVYIVIGHVDDLPPFGLAPGADDNASGTVTVLESAKAMSCYAFRSTVKFIACTGEELGLLGSDAYAADAKARGEDIRAVLDFDMNGWQGDGLPGPENLDLICNAESLELGQLLAQSAADYGTGLAVDAFLCPEDTGSDHASFWRRGYRAVFGITDDEGFCGHPGNYPYYHSRGDTIAHCGDRTFFYSTIKATVAALATLAEPFKITFAAPSTACEGSARLHVGDRDLNANPTTIETVSVEVWSTTEPTPESVVLTEQGVDSMNFSADVALTTAPSLHGDGRVSVGPGDTVTARYVDALDCDGGTSVSYTAASTAECALVAPGEVTGLSVTQGASTHLEWAATAGAASYDVASGLLSELIADGGYGRAVCLADDLIEAEWDDTRDAPPVGDGHYYLVRAENLAGAGTWGLRSDGTERSVLTCP